MKIDLKQLPNARLDFISPMLAKPTEQLPSGAGWLYEVKLDGYRTLVMKKRGKITIFSRRGNVVNARYPKMPAAFDFLTNGTIVDGELVVLDDQGKPSFSALQHSRGPVTSSLYFYAFDLLAYAGSIYEAGERSGAWLKYKTNKGQELVIAGYKPGPVGFDYLLAGYYEGDDLIFIAKIKNGFTPALRRKVAESFAGLKTTLCPFANLPEPQNARRGEAITAEVMRNIQWLKPKLVAQIEFTEWTKGNHLRHSKFIGLRDDKKPREVVKEELY